MFIVDRNDPIRETDEITIEVNVIGNHVTVLDCMKGKYLMDQDTETIREAWHLAYQVYRELKQDRPNDSPAITIF